MNLFIIFFVATIVLFLLAWMIRPTRATTDELKNFLIHPAIPSQFKNFEGIEIHFHQVGTGPDLVLIHGIGASTYIWRNLIPILSRQFRVTAIDLPGFGRSQKVHNFNFSLDSMSEFVAKFLASVGVLQFGLVGSSMGANISLWIAKNHPTKCNRVVSIAPAADPSLVVYSKFILSLLRPLHFLVNSWTMKMAVHNVLNNKKFANSELVQGYLLPFRDDGSAWKCFLNATHIVRDPRLPTELAELNSRPEFHHLSLWGDDDRVVPKRVQDELKKILSNSQFLVLKSLGHHPFEEDPAGIALLIEDFFLKKPN